jgi:hypothetical protein
MNEIKKRKRDIALDVGAKKIKPVYFMQMQPLMPIDPFRPLTDLQPRQVQFDSFRALTDLQHSQPRQVEFDRFGYIDTFATPDAQHIGLRVNLCN